MPKFIIHADADIRFPQPQDYQVGHFYIELQGDGLDKGNLALFHKSATGSIYVGFNPGTGNAVGSLTDEYLERGIGTSQPPLGMISKEIILTEAQFLSLKTAIEAKIVTTSLYVPLANDCIDFVQDMYNAAGGNGKFVDLFTSYELTTLSAAGFAARHLGNEIQIITNTALNGIADLTVEANHYLNERIFTDSKGLEYHMVQSGVDTLTVPDPDIPTAYVTKTLVVGTDSPDLLTTNGTIVFANNGTDTITVSANSGRNTIEGGAGFDTVSYAASSQPIDVDLSAGNIVRGEAMVEQVVDTVINVEGVTGTDYNDAFRGTPKAHSAVRFEGGKGDDSYELYSSDKTAYTLVDNEGNNHLEVNGHPLTGTAQPVTNRPEGTTFTLKAEDNNLYVLTRINDGGVTDSSGKHLKIQSVSDGDANFLTIQDFQDGQFYNKLVA